MTIPESFYRLGLTPTVDKYVIKKAYAKMTQECHPEEKPEEWKLLHDAYKTALSYAEKNSHSLDPQQEQKDADLIWRDFFQNEDLHEEEADEDYQEFFENLDEFAGEKNEKLKKEIEEQIASIKKMKGAVQAKCWNGLFYSEGFEELCMEEAIAKEILQLVEKKFCFLASLQVIYEALLEWQIVSQIQQKKEIEGMIRTTIGKLVFKWNLSERKIRKLRNHKKKPLWTAWHNLWHLPFWVKAGVVLFLNLLHYQQGEYESYFFLYLIVEIIRYSLRAETRDRYNKGTLFKKDRKAVKKAKSANAGGKGKVVSSLGMTLGCLISSVIVIGRAVSGCYSPVPENELKTHSSRVILHAMDADEAQNNSTIKTKYVFYLFNEGESDECVLAIKSTEQNDFETLLQETDHICYKGRDKYTGTDDVVADYTYYTLFSHMNAAGFVMEALRNPVNEAAEWLNQSICWVTSFEKAEET